MKIWNVSIYQDQNIAAKEPLDRYSLLERTEERAFLKASGQNISSHVVISGGEPFAIEAPSEEEAAQTAQRILEDRHIRDFYS